MRSELIFAPGRVHAEEQPALDACVKAALEIKERPLADPLDTARLVKGLWNNADAVGDIAATMNRICSLLEQNHFMCKFCQRWQCVRGGPWPVEWNCAYCGEALDLVNEG